MKNLLFLSVCLLATFQSWAADGIQFFEGTLDEAKALAVKERKIIFIDAYTSWCGPCKRMSKEVFTKEEVGTFFNKHFVNMKIDMEKGEGPKVAQKYSVTSYPTFLFVNEKGEIVHLAKGGRPADQFVAVGQAALSKNDNSAEYAEKYEEGDRSPEFLLAYAYELNKGGKSSLSIANQYLRTQEDLTTEQNIDFLYDFATEADSKIFDLLVANKSKVIARKSKESYENKVQEACDATVKKAIEFKVANLVDEAKKQMKKANPSFAKQYDLLADINYNKGQEIADANLAKLLEKYLKKYAKEDAEEWHEEALYLLRLTDDKKVLAKAAEWAETANKLAANPVYAKTLAAINVKLSQPDVVNKAAAKAKNMRN